MQGGNSLTKGKFLGTCLAEIKGRCARGAMEGGEKEFVPELKCFLIKYFLLLFKNVHKGCMGHTLIVLAESLNSSPVPPLNPGEERIGN